MAAMNGELWGERCYLGLPVAKSPVRWVKRLAARERN